MSIIKKVEIITSYILGKKEKKSINKELVNLGILLELNDEYVLHKCKEKLTVITLNSKPIIIHTQNSYIPTLYFTESNKIINVAYLDLGAYKPILGGADVMAPGIYKYRDMIGNEWNRGDIVAVEIIDKGLVGIGIAELASVDIKNGTQGKAINMLHVKSDAILTHKF